MPIAYRGQSLSYGHSIYKLHDDDFTIEWTTDTKHERIRYPKRHTRCTDLAGAKRFAKKWKIDVDFENFLSGSSKRWR